MANYTFKDAAGVTQTGAATDIGGGVLASEVIPLVGGLAVASGNPLPVSASSLPLPAGAATSANQTTEITALNSIATNGATAANQVTANTSLATIATSVGNIPASPATAGNQATANTSLAAIATSVAGATPAGGNIIGKVGTDQTNHGVSDLVAADITKVGGTAIALSNSGIPVDAAGTKVTAATIPTGGVGLLGWLSAIWYQLTQVITAQFVSKAGNGVPSHSWISDGVTYQVVIKNAAGNLFKLEAFNNDTVNYYLAIYNLATNPNRASNTPVDRIVVPPGGYVGKFPVDGELYSTGIAFTFTKGSLADTDTTLISANLAAVNYSYL